MGISDLTGQTIGQFELRELYGVGGMGAVYRAYQRSLEREVAFKVISMSLASDEEYIKRFYREAKTSAALEHPHIVPVYDYGRYEDVTYVAMRLLTGGSLHERMKQRSEKPPSLGEIADLLAKLASALDYAHSRGVIHRDIKANNVMFDNHGTPYLVDFGIAKVLDEGRTALTQEGAVMGTPSHMAPEQWRGDIPTAGTDLYALGVMVYQMLTGRVPFEAPTPYGLMLKHMNEMPTPPQAFRADLPESISIALEKSMAKEPADRYPNATAFAQAFAAASEGSQGENTGMFIFKVERPTIAPTKQAPAAPGATVIPGQGMPGAMEDGPTQPVISDGPTVPPKPLPMRGEEATAHVETPRPGPSRSLIGLLVVALVVIGGFILVQILNRPPESDVPVLVTLREITARSGPSTQFATIFSLAANEQYDITGISEDGSWYQVTLPDGSSGWVASSGSFIETRGPVDSVAMIIPPTQTATEETAPRPTQTASATFTASPSDTPTEEPSATSTPTLTLTPTDTPTSTLTHTPTPATPIGEVLRQVSARSGPGMQYPEVRPLLAEETVELIGVSEDGSWYQILMSDGNIGWLAAANMNVAGAVNRLEVAQAPTETPTLTSTPTDTATNTPTFTPTATDTATNTPTFTPTYTDTPSPTATFTVTPSPTSTSTPSPTSTFTITPSPTTTATASDTPTITPTYTPTVVEGELPTIGTVTLRGSTLFRNGPGVNFEVIDTRFEGDFSITGRIEEPELWVKVDLDGMPAWMAGNALNATVKIETEIVAPAQITPGVPLDIAFDDVIDTRLERNQGEAVFLYQGKEGEIISAAVLVSEFDATLELYGPDSTIPLFVDDDSGGNLLPLISGFELQSDGEYRIVVRGYSDTSFGTFRFTLEEGAMPLPTGDDVVAYNETITDDLGSNEVDTFRFKGKEGDVVSIVVRAAFDTNLELMDSTGQRLKYDDDSGGEFNPLIELYPLPNTGEYQIIVRGYDANSVGRYDMTLTKGITEETTPISYGQTLNGLVQPGQSAVFVFNGAIEDRISITVESGFDANLAIRDPLGVEILRDDDSGGNLQPAVTDFRLPSSGDYLIVISGFAETDTGPFTIVLTGR